MYKMTSFLCICGPDCIRKHELTQSEAPPNSRRVLSQATVLRLCLLLSFRCSHRRRFTSLSVQSIVAECVRQHGYRTGDGFWTSTLAIATTTDHNNAYNNNITATKKLVFWSEDVATYRCGPQNPPTGGCYHSCVAKTEKCNLGFNTQCSE